MGDVDEATGEKSQVMEGLVREGFWGLGDRQGQRSPQPPQTPASLVSGPPSECSPVWAL